MQRWNPSARPVPTDAIRDCLAAASQLSTRVVIDPGSETEFVIRRPAIARIAQSLDWQPAELNSSVRGVIERSVASESEVVDFELRSADPEAKLAGAELEVALTLVNGSSPADVRQLLERVSKYWAESEEFALAVDSVSIKLLAS
jgi:predicted amino acid dehydrogenase